MPFGVSIAFELFSQLLSHESFDTKVATSSVLVSALCKYDVTVTTCTL